MQLSNTQKLIFFDDFSSRKLDREKWNIEITGEIYNNEQQAYVDSPETIYITDAQETMGITSGGALVIHPRYRPGFATQEGKSFDFISGRIDTRDNFDFMYGTIEARIRLPAGRGLWPAFWAMGTGNWPDTGEIDIMEYVGEPDWISSAVHGPGYFGEGGLVNNLYLLPENDATDWHVYSVEWFPDLLLFKMDDKLIYRVSNAMIDFHGGWAFDNKKYLILNFALGGIYPFKINAVNDPYYGLPEETVELIKRNLVKVMVDWVKVTRI